MWCPQCVSQTTIRSTIKRKEIHRIRECTSCNYIFQTIEAPKNSSFWKGYIKKLMSDDELSKV